jgi:hypothetical protein
VTVRVVYLDRTEVRQEPCEAPMTDGILTSAWGRSMRAAASAPDELGRISIRFPADAKLVQLDPLDPRTWKLGQPWRIGHPLLARSVDWIPSEAELIRLTDAIGASTGIDPRTAPAQLPPELVVTTMTASNNEILAGGKSVLELRVTNRGQGPAYRVYATLRSSVASLQGLQFSFGRIEPGATVSRSQRIELPENTEEDTAMLVVVFHEANGFSPANFSHRFPVRVVAGAPRLSITCATADGNLEVDAGEVVRLRCVIKNEGGRAANQVTTLAVVGTQRVQSRPVIISSRASETIELPLRIPTHVGIDQQLAIAVTASEPAGGQRAGTTVAVTIRRPRLCPSGKLTREEYRTKRASLERARAAGDLTADEFDRYDAELVGCLEE